MRFVVRCKEIIWFNFVVFGCFKKLYIHSHIYDVYRVICVYIWKQSYVWRFVLTGKSLKTNVWKKDESLTVFVQKSTIQLIPILSVFFVFHLYLSIKGDSLAKRQIFTHTAWCAFWTMHYSKFFFCIMVMNGG